MFTCTDNWNTVLCETVEQKNSNSLRLLITISPSAKLSGVMVEGTQIFKSSSIAESVLLLGLDHRRTLGSQHLDGLEHVDNSFEPHLFQDDAQR